MNDDHQGADTSSREKEPSRKIDPWDELKALATLNRQMQRDWKVAMHFLIRRFPNRWSLRFRAQQMNRPKKRKPATEHFIETSYSEPNSAGVVVQPLEFHQTQPAPPK